MRLTGSGAPLRPARAARVVDLVVMALLVAVQFAQRPGQTTFDTKFDLSVDPAGFLAKSLHLWNPQLSFGELQNQAYGYLFPQGPFFVVAEWVHLPTWVAQRLWSGLLLVVAYQGARRLYRAVAVDTGPWAPIVAGAAYALAPRLVGLVGVLSAEGEPAALLPWVTLPLVLAVRGRLSPRVAALLSGCAYLGVGGVNASASLAVLPLPALVILCAGRPVPRLRLGLWWVGAIALAASWWLLPLVVLGRYSPPFLDYIETSGATTSPLGWTNVTRGVDHWLFFATRDGAAWWSGAHLLATQGGLVVVTGLVSALGLAGLFRRSMPARLPLALSACLGLGLLAVGHDWLLASPLDAQARWLLDGPLAAFRNIHKVDPLVRLPLALGLAHAATDLAGATSIRPHHAGTSRGPRGHGWASWVTTAVVTSLLVASSGPLLAGATRQPGWDTVPASWRDAAAYLAQHSDGRRTLVLPGTGFGRQTWGTTIDEPIQPLAASPWVTRSQVPLAPAASIRYLEGLEARIDDGRGSPALAEALARAGVQLVLVRHDLAESSTTTPAPERVAQALRQSTGISLDATFGDRGGALLEVYRVGRPVALAATQELAGAVDFSGAPDDVISMLEAGSLSGDSVALAQADDPREPTAPQVVGDGYRLVERQFGRTNDATSELMNPADRFRVTRPLHDYPVAGLTPAWADFGDVENVTASSSSGYADSLGPLRPEFGPGAALDGRADTYWRTGPLLFARGQWLQVSLKRPIPIDHVDLSVGVDGFSGAPIRRVRVDAGGRQVEAVPDPANGFVRVSMPTTTTDTVRVTVTDVEGPARGVVAIRELHVAGADTSRSVVVAPTDADARTDFVFRAEAHRRACAGGQLLPECDPSAARSGDEDTGLARTFSSTADGRWNLTGQVVALPDDASMALLRPKDGGVRAVASSVLGNDPAVSGQLAVDTSDATAWSSSPGDLLPSLTLEWTGQRSLTSIRVDTPTNGTRVPARVRLQWGGGYRDVDLEPGEESTFSPIRTDRVQLYFPLPPQPAGAPALPLTVTEVALGGLGDLERRIDPAAAVTTACGAGPGAEVNGQSVPTQVSGTVRDVLSGGALTLTSCGPDVTLRRGANHVTITPTDTFAASSVNLTSRQRQRVHPVERSTEVGSWGAVRRTVRVGPGEAAVLRVPENPNAGWRATLGGRTLAAMRVDGWQQGYLVPAGAGGVVTLEFLPDRTYRDALILGTCVVALLLLLTSFSLWRGPRVPSSPGEWRVVPPRRPTTIVAAALVGTLLGGPCVVVGTVAGVVLSARRGRPVLTGAILVAIAALSAAAVAALGWYHFSTLPDVVAALGVGLLTSSLVSSPVRPPQKESLR
jgi:arabinofuranan 3-O-arabinosyltransferase